MSYLVLARKWRPKGFDDLIGQEPIMRILKNAITQNKIAHAYLFSGPRGVGKTSTARILSKALNCKEGPTPFPCGVCDSCTAITGGSSVDVMEIDGASNNSVEDIRDLRERVKYAPSSGRYKVYIIDETHMLSVPAFNALLKTLEEPPSHVIFVLATTALKKIPATIISRCQNMPFRRISSNEIRARLKDISESEAINISAAALNLIARAADGSMRDSLTILDQLSSFSSEITEEHVKSLLGIADLAVLSGISKSIISGNRPEILETINQLSEQGVDFKFFTKELVKFFRDLLVASVMQKPEDVLDYTNEELSAVKDIISASSADQLTLMLSEIMKAEADVRNSSSPRLALEISLIRASFLSAMKPIKEAIENIDRLGRQAAGHQAKKTDEQKNLHKQAELTEEKPTGGFAFDRENSDEPSGEYVVKPVPDNAVKEEATGETRDISLCWQRTLEKIEAPLSSKLSQAGFELKGDELFLALNGGQTVFKDAISKNLKLIEKILSEEAGSRIKIKIETFHKKTPHKKDLKERVMDEPVVKDVLELFDGRIVDVSSLENSGHTDNGGKHV